MAKRARGGDPRRSGLLRQARVNLISRTARAWSRLGRGLIKDLRGVAASWLERVQKAAEASLASGIFSEFDAPPLPEGFERSVREAMIAALAQGYWLQHVFVKECEAAAQGKRYRIDADDPVKAALESLTGHKVTLADDGDDEAWHQVIPQDSINWIQGYTPKLAGVLERDVLEKTRDAVGKSMLEGSTLKERMEALRAASPKLAGMTQARIEAIARTEMTRADTMGRLLEMKSNPDVLGVEFCAILDSRTSEICDLRHGLVMRMDDPRLPRNTPPLHVNCRSMLCAATVYEHPDGLLTSHEFDDGELPGPMQRPEDVEVVRELLGAGQVQAKAEPETVEPEGIQQARAIEAQINALHSEARDIRSRIYDFNSFSDIEDGFNLKRFEYKYQERIEFLESMGKSQEAEERRKLLEAGRRYSEIQKEITDSQAAFIRHAPLGLSPIAGTEDWAIIIGKHGPEECLIATNPNYSKGKDEWTQNCQRCVPAYEMRRRGFDVVAKPCILTGEDKTKSAWKKIFKDAEWKHCRQGTGQSEVEAFMKQWGDGARAEVYVEWIAKKEDGSRFSHVFVAENIGGKVRYVDPQSGNVEYSDRFLRVAEGRTEICRIDTLEPSELITECCEPAHRGGGV